MDHYQLPTNSALTLQQPANPTTGYTWDILLSPGLKLIHNDYVLSSEAQRGMPGAGGMQIWSISAENPGTYYVALWNHRPWMPPDLSQAKLITVTVHD